MCSKKNLKVSRLICVKIWVCFLKGWICYTTGPCLRINKQYTINQLADMNLVNKSLRQNPAVLATKLCQKLVHIRKHSTKEMAEKSCWNNTYIESAVNTVVWGVSKRQLKPGQRTHTSVFKIDMFRKQLIFDLNSALPCTQ